MLTRLLTPVEKGFRTIPEFVQMALRVADPLHTPRILSNLTAGGLGLHLRLNGDTMIAHSEPPKVTRIPESIRDLQEAASYLRDRATPAPEEALAAVGANSNIIAYIGDHTVCDGGFLRFLYEHVGEDNFVPPKLPLLPHAFDSIWDSQLQAASQKRSTDPANLTRLWWRSSRMPTDAKANYAMWTTPLSSLKCYDREKGRLSGLTEDLWTALSLAVSAYNSVLNLPFGVPTCVDARPIMKPGSVNWGVCNNFLGVNVFANGITGKSTVGQVGAAFRRDFREKQNQGFFMPMTENPLRFGALVSCFSHMGMMEVKPPFLDIWIHNGERGTWAGWSVTLLTWSKVGCGWSDFHGSLRFPPNILTGQEGQGLANSIRFALEAMPRDTPVDEAIKEMQRIQSALV
jgi:hypothetical protein